MILLVDVGNTRIKWLACQDGRAVGRGDVIHRGIEPDALGQCLWSGLERPRKIVMTNVAGAKLGDALRHWISQAWSRETHCVVSETTGYGIKNAYAVPEQLGVDRWVAMIGARRLIGGSCCVIDCGTAITIDALSADGSHLGGVIFPGIRLMRESLHRDTSQIPAALCGEVGLLGKSTRDCVWGGTVYAVSAAIDGIVAQLKRMLQDGLQAVLTGGDAEALLPYLEGRYRLEPDLIFHGLLQIAEQH
jgi:type III pantothenate kinase